ncbi:MAG: phosphoribosyltransferase [Chloroflexi bacterium]|nr:phosphoribosyltransferase [Chloroflexota bacterium]
MQFRDRSEAGWLLAKRLLEYRDRPDTIVLGVPRGGVPVAYEVAQALHVPLDVIVVRKLGVPGQEELAFGAISTGGVRVLNRQIVRNERLTDAEIEEIAARETRELERREAAFRAGRPVLDVRGQVVILIDDGLATGASMRAAIRAVRRQQPARIVIAVPLAAPDVRDEFSQLVDDFICLLTPDPFYAVGLWYKDFPQITDIEVRALLTPTPEPC